MRLKCKIENNPNTFDIVQGSTFNEEYNETLDSAVINLAQVGKISNLRPYLTVRVYEDVVSSTTEDTTYTITFTKQFVYTERKYVLSCPELMKDLNYISYNELYKLSFTNDNMPIMSLRLKKTGSKEALELVVQIDTNSPAGIVSYTGLFLYDKNLNLYVFESGDDGFTNGSTAESEFTASYTHVPYPRFDKIYILNTYQETLLKRATLSYDSAIAESGKNGLEEISSPLYSYMITLMSETKLLEGVLCPNLQITQRVNLFTHEFDIEQRSCLEVILSYVNLYSPVIKVVDGSDAHTWTYDKKYRVDTYSWEARQLALKNCPEMSFNNQNLREVIQGIAQVLNYIPYVEKNVIKFKDISSTQGNFNPKGVNIIQANQSSGEFQGGTRVSFQQAINNSQVTKHIQNIGFRDISTPTIVTTENLKIELDYPIYKMDKFELCYYKKISVTPTVNAMSSTIWETDDMTYFTLKYVPFIPVIVTIYCEQYDEENPDYDFYYLLLGNSPQILIRYQGNFDKTQGYSITSSSKKGSGEELYKNIQVGESITFKFYNQRITSFMVEYNSGYYDNSSSTYIIPMLCKQNITPLIQLNSIRNYLSPDYTIFDDISYLNISLENLAQYRYATLGYDIGGTTISGFSSTYEKPYSEWWRANQNEYRTYIENILDIMDNNFPSGNTFYPNYVRIVPSSNSYKTNVIMPTSDKYKGLFFNVEYYSMNSFDMDFFKEDSDSNFMKRDAQNSALAILDNYSNNEQSKVNRYGNKEFTINARYTDIGDIQEVGTVFNEDSVDSSVSPDLTSDDQTIIIYKRTLAVNEYFISATYQGTKHYLLKDYYNTLFAKLRVTSVAGYSEAVSRNEVVNTFIDLETTKTNDEILLDFKDKNMYKYFLYAAVPTNFKEFDYLLNEDGYYNFKIYDAMNLSDISYIYTNYKKGTENVGIALLDKVANFELPYNAVSTKQSIVWNLKIKDNYSLGNYISNMKTPQGWMSLIWEGFANQMYYVSPDTYNIWNDYKGDLQSYYQYANQYGEKQGIDLFVGKRESIYDNNYQMLQLYEEIKSVAPETAGEPPSTYNLGTVNLGYIDPNWSYAKVKETALYLLYQRKDVEKKFGNYCTLSFWSYSYKNLILGMVTPAGLGAMIPVHNTITAYFNGISWTETNVWENLSVSTLSLEVVETIYKDYLNKKPMLQEDEISTPLIEYKNQDIFKDNKEYLNFSLQFNYYTNNKNIFIGDYFSKLNGLISSNNISLKNETSTDIKVSNVNDITKEKINIYPWQNDIVNTIPAIKYKSIYSQHTEKDATDYVSYPAYYVKQIKINMGSNIYSYALSNVGEIVGLSQELLLLFQTYFILNKTWGYNINNYLYISGIRCINSETKTFELILKEYEDKDKLYQMYETLNATTKYDFLSDTTWLKEDSIIETSRTIAVTWDSTTNSLFFEKDFKISDSVNYKNYFKKHVYTWNSTNAYIDVVVQTGNNTIQSDGYSFMVFDDFENIKNGIPNSDLDLDTNPLIFSYISGDWEQPYHNTIDTVTKNYVLFYTNLEQTKYSCDFISTDMLEYSGKVSDVFSVDNEDTISYPYIKIVDTLPEELQNAKYIGIYYKNYNTNSNSNYTNSWQLVFGVNVSKIPAGSKIFANFKRTKDDNVYESQANQNIVGTNITYSQDNYLENELLYEDTNSYPILFEKNRGLSDLKDSLYAPQFVGYTYDTKNDNYKMVLINNNVSDVEVVFTFKNVNSLEINYTTFSSPKTVTLTIPGQSSFILNNIYKTDNSSSIIISVTFNLSGYNSKTIKKEI